MDRSSLAKQSEKKNEEEKKKRITVQCNDNEKRK